MHHDDRTTEIQAAAMKASAEEAGIDGWLGTVLITDAPTLVDWRQDVQTVKEWMESWRVPLGVLVRNPVWARVIIDLAEERGWRVPDHVAIVCSNNDELMCEFPDPGLTAVEMPDQQQGHEAARMLDRLIDAKREGISPFAAPQTVILPKVEIISRHSTDFFAVEDPLVGQALRYIAAHLHKPLDVHHVAKAVGVARRTLDAWFQKSLGVTVTTEITRLRIERVKRELTAGDDPIGSIARRTGFASTRTLQDQFHKCTGMSPSEFRNQTGGQRQPPP
jgi:LacI family transcriptional regulator